MVNIIIKGTKLDEFKSPRTFKICELKGCVSYGNEGVIVTINNKDTSKELKNLFEKRARKVK